jgi:hypothetical protein
MTEMPFGTGGDEAEEAGRSSFDKVRYFSLKNKGDQAIIRMLTEQNVWPYTQQHGFVPTKAAPSDLKEGVKWPKTMPAICRNDPKLVKNLPGFGDCYIDSAPEYQGKNEWGKVISKTTVKVWALCVMREYVLDSEGNKIGLRDKTVEITDKDGNTKSVLDIQVINMSTKNFFGHFTGMYHVYGTVRDRDYVVTRKGEKKDVDYPPVPLDKVEIVNEDGTKFFHQPGAPTWKVYEDSMAEQGIDLVKTMLERCSTEYFSKFFVPGEGETPAQAAEGSGETEAADEAPKPSQERLASIRDRIRSHGGKGETEDAAEEAPAEA